MAMETLGGTLPAGRPAAVFAGGRTHVFAIGAGGMMNHWTSTNGLDWQGPGELLRLTTNLVPSYPCAIALGNAVHVFAIGRGGPFSNGGPLVRWFSPDGTTFLPPVEDSAWPVPGGANGIAASSPDVNRIDAFAVTPLGLVRYSWDAALVSLGAAPLPISGLPGTLPRCVPAAISSAPNVTDVFAVGPDGSALRCRSTNGLAWAATVLPPPPGTYPGPLVRSGFAAISPAPGKIELFAVTTGAQVAHWSVDGENVTTADLLPSPPMPINDGVPVAIVVDGRVEVFVIGNPLIRWQRRNGGEWTDAKLIDANLPAGGLGAAVTSDGRIDVFGLGGGGLQHWPAGIGVASNEPWANWANNLQFSPVRHCRPSTEEEVVAIVKTAERTPGVRVRAVGSSWSFTDITLPMAPGVIVETNQIDGLITHVIDQAVLTENAPAPRYLIHVEAGIQVEKLMGILDGMNLAPFTLGGSTGQTLAGVISTSVHGSDWDRGPIPNAVRAIQLVGPGGTRYWIEPDQWRITKEVELRQRLGPGVQIRYDDDLFDSVLVSMGSMGIITAVVLEATDQYFLEKSCQELRWSALKPQLASGSLFADLDPYVMVAIDPVEMGDRTCYLTTRRQSAGPKSGPGGSFDPLAAYCQIDIGAVLGYFTTAAVATPVAEALLSALTATAAAFGFPVPPPGATLAVAIPIIVGALKLAGPGAVGDFVGFLFNRNSEAAAALITYITRDALKPGQTAQDVAHKIMAPVNAGECTARGLAVEMALDTFNGAYLTFLDEAMALLDLRREEGMVLGGYIALRFVGPSRAILSPQQAARTCMIEITGLRSLNSTAPLLDELERLGTLYGAIQHWGMFSLPNLTAEDLMRKRITSGGLTAYPRLDTWRRVRREITNGGTIQTFENDFTARLGLDAPPAGVPLVWQQDWKLCSKCLGMAYDGGAPARIDRVGPRDAVGRQLQGGAPSRRGLGIPPGRGGPCPAGGTHDHSASGNYGFAHNVPSAPGQRRWRLCSKCMGMTLENEFAAPCPVGGGHDTSTSGEYTVLRNGEADWKWCNKCQGLAFGRGAQGPCPAGGLHNHPVGGSGYWLAFAPLIAPAPAPAGTIASRPTTGRTLGPGAGSAFGPASGSASELRPGRTPPLPAPRPELPHSSPEVPGERGWRRCSRCQGLTKADGKCVGEQSHLRDGPGSYVIPLNAPTAPGQAHWRLCKKCQTLVFRNGVCFAGGAHDFTGSGDYTLRPAGQNEWRYCKNCNGLWFSGNGGQGRCPAPAGVHDLGTDDYVIAPES